jgi:NAD(P)-dependent dehydrogenase (short-subunit alcohol dehydrogenase family)
MTEQGQKVAIVTGGSQGIGAGLVAAYRRRGWAVVATSRTIKPAGDPAVLPWTPNAPDAPKPPSVRAPARRSTPTSRRQIR